jgi:hypothetical protein
MTCRNDVLEFLENDKSGFISTLVYEARIRKMGRGGGAK